MLDPASVENNRNVFGVVNLTIDDQLTAAILTEGYEQRLADVIVVLMGRTHDIFVQMDRTKLEIWRNEVGDA